MQFKSSVLAAVLAAVAIADPQVDPLTVTSLSPAQSTAYVQAQSSYLQALTQDPAFTSLIVSLASDTAGLDGFTSAAAALATLRPTGTAAVSQARSLIDTLPSGAAVFYNSVLNADISIASSVVNSGQLVVSTSKSADASALTTLLSSRTSGVVVGASSTASVGSAATTSSSSVAAQTQATSGAASANTVTLVGSVAVAIFGAAVAML